MPIKSERAIVDGHGCHTALHFGVKAKENQGKVPTLYWLLKLHKKTYKARFIAYSSSCTTTEHSKLLTSCLTAVKTCYQILWSPAGKGLTSWLSFVVSAVCLSLSHWYPGSGVVLDCIDS